MRLSTKQVESLNVLLAYLGINSTDEEIQRIGLQIMRFVLVKIRRELNEMESQNE